jgi:hypothetical protein
MAKNARNSGLPYDQPVVTKPGVRYVESQFFAQDCGAYDRRGFVRDMLDSTSAVGAENGQRTSWYAPQNAEPTPYRAR